MKENSLYDKKSLREISGKEADWNEVAKDAVAFSNAAGGHIDYGIENKMSEPDSQQLIPEELPTILVNKIAGKTVGVTTSTEVIVFDNGGEVLRLHIYRSETMIAATTSGKIFVRIGDQSMPVMPEDIARLASDKGCYHWEEQITRWNWQDADAALLDSLLSQLRDSDRVTKFTKQKEDKELLDYFCMTDPESDKMTQLGVLFMGKQTQRARILNPPVIQCIKYDENGDKVNKWLWDDYSKNPQQMVDEIWKLIPEWKESTEISDGMYRRAIPAYPERVIRELVNNSLIHKPYTVRGDIFINIYPQYIEVVNPGLLPLGITKDNILHKTQKRNELMANLFYALHLMEREGSGYDMMYLEQLVNGKAVPDVYEGDDYVKVTVNRRILNPETIKIMQKANHIQDLKVKPTICLGIIAQHESVTASTLIKELCLRNANELRPWLNPLIEKELVISTSVHSKAKEYRVTPILLQESDYKGRTSLKRIEDYRIRELIIEDLKIYKESPLKDIHKRIGTEIPYKKVLAQIKMLVVDGKVKLKGENRWVVYCLNKASFPEN